MCEQWCAGADQLREARAEPCETKQKHNVFEEKHSHKNEPPKTAPPCRHEQDLRIPACETLDGPAATPLRTLVTILILETPYGKRWTGSGDPPARPTS